MCLVSVGLWMSKIERLVSARTSAVVNSRSRSVHIRPTVLRTAVKMLTT